MSTDRIAKNTSEAAHHYTVQRFEAQVADLKGECSRERAAKLEARAEVRKLTLEGIAAKQRIAELEKELDKWRKETPRRALRDVI